MSDDEHLISRTHVYAGLTTNPAAAEDPFHAATTYIRVGLAYALNHEDRLNTDQKKAIMQVYETVIDYCPQAGPAEMRLGGGEVGSRIWS